MSSSRRFLLLLALAVFNIGAIYTFFLYGETAAKARDDGSIFLPPEASVSLQHDVPGSRSGVFHNATAGDSAECAEINGKPCKWWPKVEGLAIVCVYSSDHPEAAAGALFDTLAECCSKYCNQQQQAQQHHTRGQGQAHGSEKRERNGLPSHLNNTARVPWYLNKTARVEKGIDLPVEEEAALRAALKVGKSLIESDEHAEQCQHLLQERADLQRQIGKHEKKITKGSEAATAAIWLERNLNATVAKMDLQRHIGNLEKKMREVTAAHQTLERNLNDTIAKMEDIRCSNAQLIVHRLNDGRLINDPTLPWNTTMHRPWLDPQLPADERPPFMLLLTTKGWNQPGVVEGLRYARHKLDTEFYAALVNHPYFHPTAWDDIESGALPIQPQGVNYYVFPDVAQSQEHNYPVYGAGRDPNMDRSFHRTLDKQYLIDGCRKTFDLASARLFKTLSVRMERDLGNGTRPSTANLFVFAVRGHEERGSDRRPCTKEAHDMPMVIASLDGRFPYINEDRGDQGMIPPLVNRATLTSQEERDIETCDAEAKKRFHVTYVGNFRSKGSRARANYRALHDNKRIIILRYFKKEEMRNSVIANMTYQEVLKSSEFALAPRGDNKFSFRFSEVLSAGAVPVYHADDYVFPIRPEIVDWHRCAVILPENMAGRPTLDRIANMSAAERCSRRKYCYFGIYKRYIESPAKQLNGYVEGLEAVLRGNDTVPFAGIRCNNASIASKDCNPI